MLPHSTYDLKITTYMMANNMKRGPEVHKQSNQLKNHRETVVKVSVASELDGTLPTHTNHIWIYTHQKKDQAKEEKWHSNSEK